MDDPIVRIPFRENVILADATDWLAPTMKRMKTKTSTHVIVEVLRGDARDKKNVLQK
jgi:hypothetical protein